MKILLGLNWFLIVIKLKKCVKKLFTKGTFTLKYCPCRYITPKMCEKAVYVYILTLKFIPDCFVN